MLRRYGRVVKTQLVAVLRGRGGQARVLGWRRGGHRAERADHRLDVARPATHAEDRDRRTTRVDVPRLRARVPDGKGTPVPEVPRLPVRERAPAADRRVLQLDS